MDACNEGKVNIPFAKVSYAACGSYSPIEELLRIQIILVGVKLVWMCLVLKDLWTDFHTSGSSGNTPVVE